MGSETQEMMDVPANWTELEKSGFSNPESLAYAHDERELRAQLTVTEGEYESSIVEPRRRGSPYVVAPEGFAERSEAIERLRMHMEYYSE